MRGSVNLRVIQAVAAFGCVSAFAVAAPVSAAGSYSPFDETASSALARYVRTLAQSPRDFGTLISAGKAALELGDSQAAAGFFARADEINPRSPLPQAGMAAVSVANGEPYAALPYFTRAQQLGLPAASLACDRGLAYDLLGRQATAQADYRLALAGPDAEEARRRLALSLAISGRRDEALTTLSPLMARRDSGAARARAFVLALSGDSLGARQAIESAMPGAWPTVSPLVQQLASLKAGEKAAAVNLGIFPDSSGATAFAYSSPVVAARPSIPTFTTSNTVSSISSGRLAGLGVLTKRSPAASARSAPSSSTRIAYASTVPAAPTPSTTTQQRKVWLQLASGANADSLPDKFRRITGKNQELFDGIKGYVARSADRTRLVIGPFHASSDADIFAEDLESIGVAASRWTSSESDRIVPLGTE